MFTLGMFLIKPATSFSRSDVEMKYCSLSKVTAAQISDNPRSDEWSCAYTCRRDEFVESRPTFEAGVQSVVIQLQPILRQLNAFLVGKAQHCQ